MPEHVVAVALSTVMDVVETPLLVSEDDAVSVVEVPGSIWPADGFLERLTAGAELSAESVVCSTDERAPGASSMKQYTIWSAEPPHGE